MKTIVNPYSGQVNAAFSLLDLTVANGTVLRAVVGYGDDIAYQGNTYFCVQNGVWSRGGVTSEAMRGTLNSQSVDLSVVAQDTAVFPGTSIPLPSSFLTGAWDGATVTLTSAYLAPGVSGLVNVTTLFAGMVSEVQPAGRSTAKLKVQDYLFLANLQIPLRTVQPGDYYSLFSPGNALVASAWAIANTVAAGSSNSSIIPGTAWPTTDGHGNNPQTANYFAQGKIVWTSGNNKGYASHVAAQGSGPDGVLTLQGAPPFPVQTGDGFTAYAGYDGTLGTAQSKFGNASHFAGFPHVPAPEQAA
ncbi:MAG: phage BR0599 family protein [Terriglobales bacterium]